MFLSVPVLTGVDLRVFVASGSGLSRLSETLPVRGCG